MVEGEDIYFVGSGSDPDGTIEGYQWRSSRDGILSSSDEFYSDSLSIGIHTIYFKVKDNASVWSNPEQLIGYNFVLLPNTGLGTEGIYYCVVQNPFGQSQSDNAT